MAKGTDAGQASRDASADSGSAAAALAIQKVTPAIGPTTGGFLVSIEGANFDGDTTFALAGVDLTDITIYSSSKARGVVPSRLGHAGPADLGGRSDTSSTLAKNAFRYYWGALSFAAPAKYTGIAPSQEVALADFNGDGKLDVLSSGGALLPGNGDGTLLTALPISGADAISLPTALDVDGDKKIDFLAVGTTDHKVYFFGGNGDGTFKSPSVTDLMMSSYANLATADANGDGKVDVVLVDTSGTLGIALGNGDGTFGGVSNLTGNGTVSDVLLGDTNGDHKVDVVMINSSASALTVRLGNGNGTFGDATTFGSIGVGRWGKLVDVNADGFLDVTAASAQGTQTFLGNGDGSFGSSIFSAGGVGTPIDVEVVDIDGDGKVDVAYAGPLGWGVSLGVGDGTFTSKIATSATSQLTPVGLAVGDLDGDGRLDLVSGDTAAQVGVLTNTSQ